MRDRQKRGVPMEHLFDPPSHGGRPFESGNRVTAGKPLTLEHRAKLSATTAAYYARVHASKETTP